MSTRSPSPSYSELADEVSPLLAGGGIITAALFPLAIPIIALTAIAAAPLLLVPLVIAIVAAPYLVIRGLARLAIRTLGAARH
jgi:hypothetical protein